MPWAPDYITVEQLRNYVTIADANDDAELTVAISAASRAIDLHTNRQFGLVGAPELREYEAFFDRHIGRWVIKVDDFMTVTGLVIEVTSGQQITEFTLNPLNASQESIPWEQIVVNKDSLVFPQPDEPVMVTANWGWTDVPTAIEQAVLLQASRIFARRTSPWGIAGSPDIGSEVRLLERLDPDVAVALGPFIRWWGAA